MMSMSWPQRTSAARVAQAGLGFIAVGTVEDYQRAVSQRDLWHPHGTPAATVHLSPGCILSADAPARLPGMGRWFGCLPVSWRRAFLVWLEKNFIDAVVKDDLNVIREQIGLPPVGRVLSHWQHSPQAVICAFPDWFCAPQKDWPIHSVTTGFPIWHQAGTRGCTTPVTRRLVLRRAQRWPSGVPSSSALWQPA